MHGPYRQSGAPGNRQESKVGVTRSKYDGCGSPAGPLGRMLAAAAGLGDVEVG